MVIEGFLAAGLALGTPILLAALGELLAERTGVLNVGIEGTMLAGAFAAAAAAHASQSAGAGVLAAALVGAAFAAAFAFVVVYWGADAIVVGTAMNLLALGLTGTLYRALLDGASAALVLPTLPPLGVPGLAQVPYLGPMLFRQNVLVYAALLLTPGAALLLRHTGLGLRLRALGDHPLAAASLGVPVRAYRFTAVVIGGVLSGLAGACLVLATTNTFVEGITAGRGFIALAVVVFARWSPWGALGGALLFGLTSALQFQFQAAAWAVPYQLFLALPYALTLLVLVLLGGAARAPRALATHYEQG